MIQLRFFCAIAQMLLICFATDYTDGTDWFRVITKNKVVHELRAWITYR
jgi:hypothetical protein